MNFFIFSQSSLRNKKNHRKLVDHSAFAKGHNLNPGNYNHFEVNGAKSKLRYIVS